MLLGELLLRRRCTQLEIGELKNYLYTAEEHADINEILSKLFELEDKFQRYMILIERANNSVQVTVGNQETSVSNAVKLKKAVDNKIESLTKLIKSDKKSLNIINLIEQRQKLIEEYILLENVISSNDWSVTVD